MKLPIAFVRAAAAEFADAVAWYEARRAGLGRDFTAEIDRCVLVAAERPHGFPTVHQDIRRVVTRRYPYSVYFRVGKGQVIVLAVFHSSRDPAILRNRG